MNFNLLKNLLTILNMLFFFSCTKANLQNDRSQSGLNEEIVDVIDEDEGADAPTEIDGSYLTGIYAEILPKAGYSQAAHIEAQVLVKELPDEVFSTDSEGKLRIPLAPGTYTIYIVSQDKEFGLSFPNVTVEAGRITDLGRVRLKLTGAIAGKLGIFLAQAASEGLAELYLPGLQYVEKSHINSFFLLSGIPEGIYDLRGSLPDYLTMNIASITVEEGKVTNLGNLNFSTLTDPQGQYEFSFFKELIENDGSRWVVRKNLDLTMEYTWHMVKVMISEHSDFNGAAWQDISELKTWEFSKEGLRTLYVKYLSRDGHETATLPQFFFVDSLAPTVSAFSAINAVNSTIHQRNVIFKFNVDDPDPSSLVLEYSISEDINFSGASWQVLDTEGLLSRKIYYQLSAGEGLKTVYFKVRDSAQNESEALVQNITYSVQPDGSAWTQGQKIMGSVTHSFDHPHSRFNTTGQGVTSIIDTKTITSESAPAIILFQDGSWLTEPIAVRDYASAPIDKIESQIDENGNILVMWTEAKSLTNDKRNLFARYYIEASDTWQSIIALSDEVISDVTDFHLIRRGTNDFLFVYSLKSSISAQLIYREFTGQSQTFADATNLASNLGQNQLISHPIIVSFDNLDVLVLWSEAADGISDVIKARIYDSGGPQWDAATEISSSSITGWHRYPTYIRKNGSEAYLGYCSFDQTNTEDNIVIKAFSTATGWSDFGDYLAPGSCRDEDPLLQFATLTSSNLMSLFWRNNVNHALNYSFHNGTSWEAAGTVDSQGSSAIYTTFDVLSLPGNMIHVVFDVLDNYDLQLMGRKYEDGAWYDKEIIDSYGIDAEKADGGFKYSSNICIETYPDNLPHILWSHTSAEYVDLSYIFSSSYESAE